MLLSVIIASLISCALGGMPSHHNPYMSTFLHHRSGKQEHQLRAHFSEFGIIDDAIGSTFAIDSDFNKQKK